MKKIIKESEIAIIKNTYSRLKENGKANFKLDKKESDVLDYAMDLIDSGHALFYEKKSEDYITNIWVKQFLYVYIASCGRKIRGDSAYGVSYDLDKIGSKFENWTEKDFEKAKIRNVMGSVVRKGASIGENVVLMPSFVNTCAHVGSGTMIDTWSTVGSCAYVGKNCHISGGAGISGALEPLDAMPGLVEDNCFIGARCQVSEGVRIGHDSVLSSGVFLSATTKIFDRTEGKLIPSGYIPPHSVVVPGSIESSNGAYIYCAHIVKKVTQSTKSKVSINEILR